MTESVGWPVAERFKPVSGVGAVLERRWPMPAPPGGGAVLSAAGVGLLAAALIPGDTEPGIGLPVCGVATAVPVAVTIWRRGRAEGRRRPIGRVRAFLGVVALGLVLVAAVRASDWLVWGCAVAALSLGAAVALDSRRWPAVFFTLPLFGVAVLRALPWSRRVARPSGLRDLTRPWMRGLTVGLACTAVVAALLASADDAFADLVSALFPSVEVDLVPARIVMFALAAATMLGALFAAGTRLTLPRAQPGPADVRHPAEWLTPLLLVTLTIAAFLAVEATMLFGGASVVHTESVSHAERAREGFGQLTVVTVIVLLLLSWAGRRAADGPARHRLLMGSAGGLLLVVALLLAASALRRLWLYQDAYGWTVTRLEAGAFELWVALLLAGIAVSWLLRRTDLLPRLLIGSAGAGLLVIGLLGPDALVARANVDRYQHTQMIDLSYAAWLSADAVPALDRLPEPARSCALAGRLPDEQPWYHWNLASSRATSILRARPAGACFLDPALLPPPRTD